MSWKGVGIEEKKMFSSGAKIARNLLKQLLKSSIKFFDSFVLLLSHFTKSQQQHVRIFFSAPSFHEGLFEGIPVFYTLARKRIILSPSVFNKSGRKEFHHYIFSIITYGMSLETTPEIIYVFFNSSDIITGKFGQPLFEYLRHITRVSWDCRHVYRFENIGHPGF
jgi:hypothetical protein